MATTGIPIDMEAGSGDTGGRVSIRAGEGANGDGGSLELDAGPSRAGGSPGTCTVGATARQTTIGGQAITIGSASVPLVAPGGVQLGSSSGPQALQGAGSPEGAVAAAVGSTYQRTDGSTSTTFYVKESGSENTGWAAVGGSGRQAARISKSANQTLTTGQVLDLTFDVEDWDTGGLVNLEDDRITFAVAGYVQITLNIMIATNSTGSRFGGIVVYSSSDATKYTSEVGGKATDFQWSGCCTGTFAVAAGDYVKATAFQSSGGDLAALAKVNGVATTYLDCLFFL